MTSDHLVISTIFKKPWFKHNNINHKLYKFFTGWVAFSYFYTQTQEYATFWYNTRTHEFKIKYCNNNASHRFALKGNNLEIVDDLFTYLKSIESYSYMTLSRN